MVLHLALPCWPLPAACSSLALAQPRQGGRCTVGCEGHRLALSRRCGARQCGGKRLWEEGSQVGLDSLGSAQGKGRWAPQAVACRTCS